MHYAKHAGARIRFIRSPDTDMKCRLWLRLRESTPWAVQEFDGTSGKSILTTLLYLIFVPPCSCALHRKSWEPAANDYPIQKPTICRGHSISNPDGPSFVTSPPSRPELFFLFSHTSLTGGGGMDAAKEWSLGCVNSPLREQRESGSGIWAT